MSASVTTVIFDAGFSLKASVAFVAGEGQPRRNDVLQRQCCTRTRHPAAFWRQANRHSNGKPGCFYFGVANLAGINRVRVEGLPPRGFPFLLSKKRA